jgi:hypothetical protein
MEVRQAGIAMANFTEHINKFTRVIFFIFNFTIIKVTAYQGRSEL